MIEKVVITMNGLERIVKKVLLGVGAMCLIANNSFAELDKLNSADLQNRFERNENYITTFDFSSRMNLGNIPEEDRPKERTKQVLDYLWDFPNKKYLKGETLIETTLLDLEEEFREDYSYLEITYHDLLFSDNMDRYEDWYYQDIQDIDIDVMIANSFIRAAVKHWKWVRTVHNCIETIKEDYASVKGEVEGFKFRLSGSLDKEYDPKAELCLKYSDWRIEYLRSLNESEAFIGLKDGFREFGFGWERDFKEEKDTNKKCVTYLFYYKKEF